MPIEHLFSSPVYYGHVTPEQLTKIKTELDAALPKIRGGDMIDPWPDRVQTSFKYGKVNNDIEEYGMQHLSEAIREHARLYLLHLGSTQNSTITINSSWTNVTAYGEYHQGHTHTDADLCAVYYHQTNGDDGALAFSSPSPAHTLSRVFVKHVSALEVRDGVSYKPEVGKIIVFPAYLRHAVFENKTNGERISVATNITVE